MINLHINSSNEESYNTMKITINTSATALIIATILGASATSAFNAPSFRSPSQVSLKSSYESPEEAADLETLHRINFSKSIPVLPRPKYLTGTMAGDVGFDPLGFVKSEQDLIRYREAEVKHARLGMLAAAGWPLSELLQKKFAFIVNMAPTLDSVFRAPSFITDFKGFDANCWFVAFTTAAFVDFYGTVRAMRRDPDYFPGNLGFDPLGLYPEDEEGRATMQLAEIKHGRTAMMAVFFYAVEEYFTKHSIMSSL